MGGPHAQPHAALTRCAYLPLRAQVRLRVVATRIDASEIFAIGTIKEEYLGLVE